MLIRMLRTLAVAIVLASGPALAAGFERLGCAVLVIPADDFSEDVAREFADILRDLTGLQVLSTLRMGMAGLRPFPDKAGRESPQFSADRMMDIALPAVRRLRVAYGDGLAIILTRRDINANERTFNWLFAHHNLAQMISVISVHRMFASDGSKPVTEDLVVQRLMKFMLRAVGEQVYRLARTTNIDSVMYAPIMSHQDLDAMGMRLDGHGDPCKSTPTS